MIRCSSAGVMVLALLTGLPADARTPNLEGVDVTPDGSAFFSFLHRFQVGTPPTFTVTNLPTFHVSTGWGNHAAFGALYATETLTVPGASQELELFAKQRLLDEASGSPFSLTARAAFNVTAISPDVEIAAAHTFGPVGLLATVRGLGNYQYAGTPQLVGGFGGRLAATDHVDLVGDIGVGWPRSGPNGAAVWGAGLAMRIPYTPHTLALQASNASTTTSHGASVPTGAVRYGFDFTIPFASVRPWLEMWRRSDAGRPGLVASPRVPEDPTPGVTAREDAVAVKPKPRTSRAGAVADGPSGGAIFAARCASCHGAKGAGGFGPDLRPVEAKGDAFVAERVRRGSPKGMPAFGGQLTEAEMAALVLYVKSL